MTSVGDMMPQGARRKAPAIDRNEALEMLDGDVELYIRLVEMLVARAEHGYLKMLQAVDDTATLERLAHNLKGVSANMAAEPLRQVSEELEMHARVGNSAGFRKLLPLLRERVNELAEFAKRENASPDPCP
jgi:HPt (histidine-containing phosphotransfer) domain-containing protein